MKILFFLFQCLLWSGLARNKARKIFFNFLNFYTIFWEYSKSGWVGMDLERNFFSSFKYILSLSVYLDSLSSLTPFSPEKDGGINPT